MKKVTAALLIKDKHIFIAKRSSQDKLGGLWEFPGGKIEEGESPEECLKREMKEEFKIEVKVKDFYVDSIYNYEHGSIQLMAYWAEWVDGELVPMVHDDIKWIKAIELKHYKFAPADIPIVEKILTDKDKLNL